MKYILSERKDGVLIIRLNRPEKYNSFNREMALELQEKLKAGKVDPEVRAIYLTGEGKAFCAGQDLSEAISPDGPGITKIVNEHYNPIIHLIREIEKPVVCGVNGVAAGAGANIALACDIVVASSDATFIQAFSGIGLIPDSGGTFFLPRLIGFQRASALMMLGDKVSAAEAFTLGMVYKIYDGVIMQDEAFKFACILAGRPTYGIGLTKRLLNASFNSDMKTQLELEAEMQTLAAQSLDYKEGVNAFLEKRKPKFIGK
jgi:2-(1,2-epoxy-1,2-dihydrophenyl)acetyl-CoA isomerase